MTYHRKHTHSSSHSVCVVLFSLLPDVKFCMEQQHSTSLYIFRFVVIQKRHIILCIQSERMLIWRFLCRLLHIVIFELERRWLVHALLSNNAIVWGEDNNGNKYIRYNNKRCWFTTTYNYYYFIGMTPEIVIIWCMHLNVRNSNIHIITFVNFMIKIQNCMLFGFFGLVCETKLPQLIGWDTILNLSVWSWSYIRLDTDLQSCIQIHNTKVT